MVPVMPGGALVIVPLPPPAPLIASVCGAAAKFAVTLCACTKVSAQAPVPEQAPLHPANVCPPAPGDAVSETALPAGNELEQVPLATPPATVHEMPAGLDVTTPPPVPVPATVSVTG